MKKYIIIPLLIAVLLTSGCVEEGVSVCGDGICDADENKQNCPEDCGYPIDYTCGDYDGLCVADAPILSLTPPCEAGYEIYESEFEFLCVEEETCCIPVECPAQPITLWCDDCDLTKYENECLCPETVDEHGCPIRDCSLCIAGRGCTADTDCTHLNCPQVVGGDTPRCGSDGQCYCGEGDLTGEWYEQICSNGDLENYISNFEGTDQELVDQLKQYCINLETDLDGCPIYLDWSKFLISQTGSGEDLAFTECISKCDADSGHVLFSAYWYVGPPRELVMTPSAGLFTVQSHCGLQSSIINVFGLPNWSQ